MESYGGRNYFAQEESRLELNPEMILANLSALNGNHSLAEKRFYDSKFLEAFRKLLDFMNNFKMYVTELTIKLNQRAELAINRAKMIQAYLEGPKLKTALDHLGKIREEFQSAVKSSKGVIEKKIIIFFETTHETLTKKAQALLIQIAALKASLDLSSKTKVKKMNAYSKEVRRSLDYIKKTIGNTPAVQKSIKNFRTQKKRDTLVHQVEKFGTVAIKNFNSSVAAVRAFGRQGLIKLEDFSFKGEKFLENAKGITLKNLEDLLKADMIGIQNLQNITGKKEFMKLKNEFGIKINDNATWEFLMGVGLKKLKGFERFLTVDWKGKSQVWLGFLVGLGLGKLEVAEKGLSSDGNVKKHATRVLKNLVDQGYTDPMYFNLIRKLTTPQFKIAIADLRRKISYKRQKKFSRRTWRVIVGLGETNMTNILALMKLYRKNLTNSEQHAVYFGPDHWDTLKKIGSTLV